MGSVLFVRHAQASFFADDYDVLSALGARQARLLGAYWSLRNARFDECVIGPRKRHRQTANYALKEERDVSSPYPDLVEASDFDEHHVDRLLIAHGDSLAASDVELGRLVEAYRGATDQHEQARRFQMLFERATMHWLDGGVERSDVEPWRAFQSRVNRGITNIVRGAGRGRRVVVFTSVGVISVAFQRATGCDDRTAMATGWRIRNCSLTNFLFSGDRFTLDQFNALPHLSEACDQTFR